MAILEIITGVVPELEEVLVARICKECPDKSLVFVARSGKTLEALGKTVKFFDQTRKIITFPGWDSALHGNTSPSSLVMSSRIKALSSLIAATEPYIVLTTPIAVTQKVLARHVVHSLPISVATGEKLSIDSLTDSLTAYGYTRLSAVREVGSLAARGEIIDIFQPTDSSPVRICFDCDTVESIRYFDLDTQLTHGAALSNLLIYPVSELIKTQDSIQRFYSEYVQNFNVDKKFAEAVLSGRKYIGEEQWLPLFHDLETFFSYTEGADLIFSDASLNNISHCIQKVWSDYNPKTQVSPDSLFLSDKDYECVIRNFNTTVLCQLDSMPQGIAHSCTEMQQSQSSVSATPDFRQAIPEVGTDIFKAAVDYVMEINKPLLVACYSERSLEYLIERFEAYAVHLSKTDSYADKNKFSIAILPVVHSAVTPELIVITEYSLLGRQYFPAKSVGSAVVSEYNYLEIGDIVVHKDYGIGMFNALRTLPVCGGACHDFMEILYNNNSKLFVPVEDVDLVTKYGTNGEVALDNLGSEAWQTRKAKLQNRIREIAKTLLHSEAMRLLTEGSRFSANQKYLEFCKEFPYIETEDQLKAISEVESDLASGRVMDRLICGDVGFGKTEVAMRAAFLILNENPINQVAVIVPTTLLCRQHFVTFSERFREYGIIVKQLSKSVAQHKSKIKKELAEGDINIIIGTSALLSEDVKFLELSLLIIDEEQHFGVRQKERLKALKHDVHVLSLSATPIPRTLHMSLSGLKSLSVLKTPPIGRMAVDISIIRYDGKAIKEAILYEINRGGRVFIVCPLIKNLEEISHNLNKLLPEVKVEIAHGKTSAHDLNKIMNDFFDGKFSVLLTTSIIESGIDIPIANTIIVYDADMFGLAQLYQLKGRVGRGTTKGYAYFVISNKAVAGSPGIKRLEAIRSLNSTGSGFSIALQDMDIRGFGNLIGEEQSGNIKEVGIELYHKMLEEEIAECNQNASKAVGCHNVKVNINANVRIPESYVRELNMRMKVYRKISGLKTAKEVENYLAELTNRFGAPPSEVVNLLNIMRVKQLCADLGISEITQNKADITLFLDKPSSEKVIRHLVHTPEVFAIQGDHVKMSTKKLGKLDVITYVLSHLVQMQGNPCIA